MIKKVIFLAGILTSSFAFSQPPKAAMCAGCHGVDGISLIPNYPNLKGQKELYLYEQLKNFKSGARQNPLMSGMAAGLSDDEMKALAKYYSEMK